MSDILPRISKAAETAIAVIPSNPQPTIVGLRGIVTMCQDPNLARDERLKRITELVKAIKSNRNPDATKIALDTISKLCSGQ